VKRINHQEAYSFDGLHQFGGGIFSRMRRMEIGHHHHLAGPYLLRYAQETAWREDNRRQPNGEHVNRLGGLALKSKPSVDFSGYWQRHEMKEGLQLRRPKASFAMLFRGDGRHRSLQPRPPF
jgi:hypothetical protein